MNEPEINKSLATANLFELFRAQLKKDFEGAGVDASFTSTVSNQFEVLRNQIALELEPIAGRSQLQALLYRVDISENQIARYTSMHNAPDFSNVLSELIIKRILQKVILKINFSSR